MRMIELVYFLLREQGDEAMRMLDCLRCGARDALLRPGDRCPVCGAKDIPPPNPTKEK